MVYHILLTLGLVFLAGHHLIMTSPGRMILIVASVVLFAFAVVVAIIGEFP